MFIEKYKLERNPFAEDSVKPLFVSQAMRDASFALRKVLAGDCQSLFISGVAGVGKTTLLAHRQRSFEDVSVTWIGPDIGASEGLLQKLLHDIGPGYIKGSLKELRHILNVYLTHQRLHGRLSLIIADAVERQSNEVLLELESLWQVNSRGVPAVQFVFLTRNENLAAELMREHAGSRLMSSAHSRLAGFTLEETKSYIRDCLQGAGCDWANELIPDEVVFDIQAFTQGVVGDINSLCCAALDKIASIQQKKGQIIKVGLPLLKQIGASLNLRHNPEAWLRPANEKLTADTEETTDSWADLELSSARLIVSSEGRQLAEVSLNRPRMILGRDSTCDISLDSHYLSRYQNLFMETDEGWVIIDLNSTNGCYVNGRRVREHRLKDGDVIGVGQHQLRFRGPAGSKAGLDDLEKTRRVRSPAARAKPEQWSA